MNYNITSLLQKLQLRSSVHATDSATAAGIIECLQPLLDRSYRLSIGDILNAIGNSRNINKNQTVISWRVYITMVTQCDWSWYLDLGLLLITCYNKSTRRTAYQYDSAHCIQQRRNITHTEWLCIVGRNYNKNQNFCGGESISREIGSTQTPNLVKSGQRKNHISWNRVKANTRSREIRSTQKRNLVKSGQHHEIRSTQKPYLVKSGQHKNKISCNRVNTKTKSSEIGSSRDFLFIIQYVSAYVNLDL